MVTPACSAEKLCWIAKYSKTTGQAAQSCRCGAKACAVSEAQAIYLHIMYVSETAAVQRLLSPD